MRTIKKLKTKDGKIYHFNSLTIEETANDSVSIHINYSYSKEIIFCNYMTINQPLNKLLMIDAIGEKKLCDDSKQFLLKYVMTHRERLKYRILLEEGL